MNKLLSKMQSAGSIKYSFTMDESAFFNKKDVIPTDLPILNIAFSGDVDGGLIPGLTILAGASKSFKTLLSLYCLKGYFNKYPDAICLFYDSEFGVTPEYLRKFDIDPTRIIHIPIEHVEQLKFDIVNRLKEIERGDKVFILLDSLGSLASKREVENAENEKSVSDMSRAQAIRSLLRIITPHLTMKDLPMLMVNHIYQTMELYSQVVIPGGTAVTYAANQIFVITKSQEKDGDELVGYKFTININKSRFVKEKSKFPFTVRYDTGIIKYSGLMDIALEGDFIVKPSKGWYSIVDRSTGEIETKKYREKDLLNDKEIWQTLLANEEFKEYVKTKYSLESPLDIINEEQEEQEFKGE